MSYDPGDQWTPELTVRDSAGVLTAATVTVSVTSPSGVVSTPTPTTPSTGVYRATVLLNEAGHWQAVWTVSGAVAGVEAQHVYVRRLGSNVISITDVKLRLNKSLTVDDAEIEQMIDAALAEYEDFVGPVSGTVTETLDGGSSSLILRSPRVSALTAATYSDGSTITLTDLSLDTDTGIVHWGYGTAGAFTYGRRNVTVTYRVNGLPANHREAVIADVAGYFAATQRGPVGLPGEGYEAAQVSTPLVQFPRIRALAPPRIA